MFEIVIGVHLPHWPKVLLVNYRAILAFYTGHFGSILGQKEILRRFLEVEMGVLFVLSAGLGMPPGDAPGELGKAILLDVTVEVAGIPMCAAFSAFTA